MQSVIPKAFAGKIKVDKYHLLKGGVPYLYHNAYKYTFSFKSIYDDSEDEVVSLTASKQRELYSKLISSRIDKPISIGIGSYPAEKGCLALMSSILYSIDNNNKDFKYLIKSSLDSLTKKDSDEEDDRIPEVVCITDLCEDTMMGIENARIIMRKYPNSMLIVPCVTKNIINFFKTRLYKTGMYFQFSELKKIEEA